MKLPYIVLLCLIVFIFVGCAAFKATVDGVKENPEAFKTEAKFISTTAETALPGLPELAYLGIGYGMAFLRRWYKNLKRKEAIDKKIA